VKKKTVVTNEDKKVWKTFVDNLSNLPDKDLSKFENVLIKEVQVLDLHGLSLDEANKKVETLIDKYFIEGVEKIIIITGKGLRSKIIDDPYISKDLSILKYSVPDYINSNLKIKNKIKSISKAEIKDGGEGAFYIFLKKFRE